MKDRFVFADWAKAVGSVCICFGHFLLKNSPKKIFLYMFHVPVFFLISGFLTYETTYTPKDYIRKLTKRILIPYTVWFWLSAIPQIFILGDTLLSCFGLYLFADGMTLWNYPIWFMPCFFLVSVVHYWCVFCFAKKDMGRMVFLACVSFVAAYILNVWLDNIDENFMFLGLNKFTMMLGYQFAGSALRLIYEKRKQMVAAWHKLGIPLFVGVGVLACRLNGKSNISILFSDFNNIGQYIVFALLMSVGFLWMFMALPRWKPIELLSRNTLPLICSHYVLIPLLYPFLPKTHILYKTMGLIVAAGYFLLIIGLDRLAQKYPSIKKPLRLFGFWL